MLHSRNEGPKAAQTQQQLAWHAVSSSASLQSCRQTRFSRHCVSPMHLARATWQFCSRQEPTLATSEACATVGPAQGGVRGEGGWGSIEPGLNFLEWLLHHKDVAVA